METTLSGMVTEVRLTASAKARLPMAVTGQPPSVSGMVRLVAVLVQPVIFAVPSS